MTQAVISLGSNLGERFDHLQTAVTALQDSLGVEVEKVSSVYETEAIGGPDNQQNYLNAIALIETSLTPHELLLVLQEIEQTAGRTREVRFGPRTLDLDIIDYQGFTSVSEDLTVPHPRARERSFVLTPLFEIAPHWQLQADISLSDQVADVADQIVLRRPDYVLAVM